MRMRLVLGSLLVALSVESLVALDNNDPNVGYQSVAEAWQALAQRAGVKATRYRQWTVIHTRTAQSSGRTRWAFVSAEHPAYPSVVRQDVVMKNERPTQVTRLLCEAQPSACETLYQALKADQVYFERP